MKVSRLYLKILGTFILVQFLAMLAMFALVHYDKIRPPFARHAENRTVAIKRLLRQELAHETALTPSLRKDLTSMLGIFARAFQGEAWLTDQNGNVIVSSFAEKIPLTGKETVEKETPTDDGDTFFLIKRHDRISVYMTGTIQFAGNPLTVHLLHNWEKRPEEKWLMRGLLLMSAISALLLVPGSRGITRPLNELTQSAQKVAIGDFSPRVKIRWKDELAVLGSAFNHMAESLEKIIRGGRELTANLSHELRSPLARIRFSQQIIQDRMESGKTEGVKDHLGRMAEEIDHMDALIDKIITLSKRDLQEPPLRKDVVDLGSMLKETMSRNQQLMTGKSISTAEHLAPLPGYRCHAADMQIVLDNILTNAVKYSPENSTIQVRARANGETVVLKVTNPYPPLSETELETVFLPFKRLGYEDEVEGNGLGLAFARKIVEEHGGSITASNEQDGFCMTVRLPLT